MATKNSEIAGKIISQFGSRSNFAMTLGQHPSVVCEVLAGRRRLSPTAARTWALLLECSEELLRPITREAERSS